METKPITTRPDVVASITEPRPTPTPPRTQFSEVLARGIASGAASAASLVPGSSLLALAVRGSGGAASGALGAPTFSPAGLGTNLGTATAEGPNPSAVAGIGSTAASAALGAAGAVSGDGGIAASLAQSQDMNLYYLQVQQAVDAQSRTFETLSNVLKSESDTVKNAIGNIH